MNEETYGWRGKIGLVYPAGDFPTGPEYYPLLPVGVSLTVTTLGISKMTGEEFEKSFEMYLSRAQHLAAQECDVIVLEGSSVFSYMGFERSQEMIQKVRDLVKVPVVNNLVAHFDALRALSAKKIVIASPYEDARNQERKRLCESQGFKVLNTKGLGIVRKMDTEKLPPYMSYRVAKQAYLEAPEAEGIYISCPGWQTIRNIEKLERDTGKPVVANPPAVVWSALKAMGIKEPIKGFGRLLELI